MDEQTVHHSRRFGSVRRNLRWWIIGAMGVAFGVYLSIVWVNSAYENAPTSSQTGFEIVSDNEVVAIFDVHTAEKRPVQCDLVAYDMKHNVVGSVQVNLPVSKFASTRYKHSIKTTHRAVTATVDVCRYLPEN